MSNTIGSNEVKYQNFEKVDFGNLILKYDVINGELKVISNKNLKRPRNFDDIGTGRN
jgi:hypothetical protein